MGATAASAQQQASSGPPPGTISGSVIDATTSAPLARATVTLTSPDGLLVDPRAGSSPLSLARTVTTSGAGAYRFNDLAIGSYRLRIQRVGYEPATIDVRLGETGSSPVSIGLVVLPVRLRAMEVRAHDSRASASDPSFPVGDDSRVAAARARQQAFLSTDARELTSADVAESATLGGSDVFRSMQRLPGVTQLDDWSAELWVRGNRWDHNRVYFDDLPLFDPLGVLGRTSGVSANAIGGAFLHPGVRPVSLGGEGATRIDLRSRPASTNGDWRGSAELTQFAASMAIENERADGSAGLLETAQHSLGGWVPRDAFFNEALGGRWFSDAQVTLRADADLGDGKRIVTSGLYTRDTRLSHSDAGDQETQDWRNMAERVTFAAPIGSVATSHTIGFSHYTSSTSRFFALSPDTVIASPAVSSVDYLALSGRLDPPRSRSDAATLGYDLIVQRSSLAGTHESPFWLDSSQTFTRRSGALTYGSGWIDNRSSLGDRVTLEDGLRVDVGGGHGLDAVRLAGSAQALLALSANTRLSAGASRAHQYVQGVDLPLVGQGQTAPTSWLTAGGDVPVMAVDNAMAGIEQWVGTGTLVTANAYLRHTAGAIADDPAPGSLIHRPLFVDASESAHGVELSARQLIGRVTGFLDYSYSRATMTARGSTFTAPADRTHALNAGAFVHLGGFNLGTAYTLTSGAPYTRVVVTTTTNQVPSNGYQTAVREAPNALRLPNYASLDLSIDYRRTIRDNVVLIGFAGVQNAFDRRNATWYELSGFCDTGGAFVAGPQCRDHDVLQAPVKRAPTIGLRLVVR